MELALLSTPLLPPNANDEDLFDFNTLKTYEPSIKFTLSSRSSFNQGFDDLDIASNASKRRQSLATQGPREKLIELSLSRSIKNAQLPVKITWNNLNFTVTIKGKSGKHQQSRILKDCTGYALPGQTLYIMGASGAGKTSLLNTLANRIKIKSGTELAG